MSNLILPRGRVVMPERKLYLEKPIYLARRDMSEVVRSCMPRAMFMADQQMATQTVPAAPAAGNVIRWWDTTGNIDAAVDSSGHCYGRSTNGSIAAVGGSTEWQADRYVVDSDLKIPSFGMQTRTMFRWHISASKTGAGTATPVYQVRIGTARSTSDTSRLTLTGPAQTAIADIGTLTIEVIVRAVSASVGVIQGTAWWDHRGTAANTTTSGTGFANDSTGHVEATSANFDNTATTLNGMYVGLSINGGTSCIWTVTQVRAEVDW